MNLGEENTFSHKFNYHGELSIHQCLSPHAQGLTSLMGVSSPYVDILFILPGFSHLTLSPHGSPSHPHTQIPQPPTRRDTSSMFQLMCSGLNCLREEEGKRIRQGTEEEGKRGGRGDKLSFISEEYLSYSGILG